MGALTASAKALWWCPRLPSARRRACSGVYHLHFRQPRIFTRQQRQLLETLGQHLAAALDNQRLAATARELAVLEERNLVAQGLHDSIAQVCLLNLQTQMLEDALRRRPGALAESLGQIQAGVQESYDDVRELLTNFRASLAAEGDLFSPVDAILSAFAANRPAGGSAARGATALPLSPDQQLQVLFILQESLSNVRKHARASPVVVRIEDERDLLLTVRDDGVGFDHLRPAATLACPSCKMPSRLAPNDRGQRRLAARRFEVGAARHRTLTKPSWRRCAHCRTTRQSARAWRTVALGFVSRAGRIR